MTLARRSGIALAIAGSVLTLAAAAPRAFSPGYTYRMRISGAGHRANGKTKDYVVMSGRAMVTAKAAASTSTRPRRSAARWPTRAATSSTIRRR